MSEVMSGFKKHNLTTSRNAKHTLYGTSSYKTLFFLPVDSFLHFRKKKTKKENEALVIGIMYKQDPKPLSETTERERVKESESNKRVYSMDVLRGRRG